MLSTDCFDFDLAINSSMRSQIFQFIENACLTWAPDNPPEKVVQMCQVIAEAVGVPMDKLTRREDSISSDGEDLRTDGELSSHSNTTSQSETTTYDCWGEEGPSYKPPTPLEENTSDFFSSSSSGPADDPYSF